MKTMSFSRTLMFTLAAALLAGGMSACKSKKKQAEATPNPTPPGMVKVVTPCFGPEFYTTEKAFRFSALGESMDKSTAMKKGDSNARLGLASAINTRVKAVIDNYVNSRGANTREELAQRYESLAREVVDQQLIGTKPICTELMVAPATGQYTYYVAMELSAQELIARYNERISNDERLRIDYDYEKFKETFDKEMQNLKN